MKGRVQKMPLKKILNFIAEAGMLKRIPRAGWSVLGIKNSESVAEHSFRCAVLGYVLARMEKASVYPVVLMSLFNDIQEARITDLHKMAQCYIDAEVAEDRSFAAQIAPLPKQIKDELADLRREYKKDDTKESEIARDADILECLIQAKEYHEQGYLEAHKFMKKAPRFLKTKSARSLWQSAKKMNLNDWWVGLSNFKR